jgi:engulfment and cell motility protein 2
LLLTDSELASLNELRTTARVRYDENDDEHTVGARQHLLHELWNLLFTGAEPSLKSPRWKDVGFQGNDPGTDFRGAGIFGLKQLLYLATIYPAELHEILRSADYPFAISALNVSVRPTQHYLMSAFQLNSPKSVQLPNQMPAPARILKNFSELQARHPNSINEIYCEAVLRMHSAWQYLRRQGTSLMEFSRAIDRSKEFVYAVLRKRPTSLDELKKTSLVLRL